MQKKPSRLNMVTLLKLKQVFSLLPKRKIYEHRSSSESLLR